MVPVEPFWDGEMTTYPKPLPKGFGGPPLPEAIGKFAYVTLFDLDSRPEYFCMALALMTSLVETKPDPSIDLVIGVAGTSSEEHIRIAIGQKFYDAFKRLGVKFVIWERMQLTSYHHGSFLTMAYTKFRLWTLTQYEKVLFLDSDTLILRNMDHLFENSEFTAAAVWLGINPNSPKTPSGGFFIAEPRMAVFDLIERYLAGRDPCAMLWRNADMTMLKIMFLDMASYADPLVSAGAVPPRAEWPRFDGDLDMYRDDNPIGINQRCTQKNNWPEREDLVWALVPTDNNEIQVPRKPSPGSRWNMLNESYDLLVFPCGEPSMAPRYHKNPEGKTMWERANAFSLHISPGEKPSCGAPGPDELAQPACVQEALGLWRKFLKLGLGES